MLNLRSNLSILIIYLFIISLSNVSAQETSRNLVIPTQTSTQPAPAATGTISAPTNGTVTSNNNSTNSSLVPSGTVNNNSTGKGGTAVTTTKLAPIADATGGVVIPAPGSTGGKPNGRYGPDDQYIAAVSKIIIPWFTSFVIIGFSICLLTR